MGRYVIRRLLITIPTIIIVVIAVFSLLYITPGDPAEMILGSASTEDERAALRTSLGIDRPYLVQLGDYLYKLFIKWDLGESWVYASKLGDEIRTRLPITFAISMYSILIAVVTGIPMGVYAAVKQNSVFDRIVLVFTSILHCIPNYVFAMVFIIELSLKHSIFPAYGIGSIKHYIMPCMCIFIGSFGSMARSMRTSMLEVIRSDYVMAARAQGFSKNVVYFLHALPNAMIPIVTQLGGRFAGAMGGTLILETIFTIPGMGLYIQGGISNHDIPVILGCVVFLAIWFCLIMLAVDVVYAFLDPRIKAQYIAQGKSTRRRKTA